MENDKLKPCPFCGGAARSNFVPMSKSSSGYAYIECEKCGATPYVYQVIYGEEAVVESVSEAWNRRAKDEV